MTLCISICMCTCFETWQKVYNPKRPSVISVKNDWLFSLMWHHILKGTAWIVNLLFSIITIKVHSHVSSHKTLIDLFLAYGPECASHLMRQNKWTVRGHCLQQWRWGQLWGQVVSKSIQCVYWSHEYSLDKWAYEPKTHIFIWLVYISTEKQLQRKHLHTYLLNVYHLKSWDFKSGVRYGVQDLSSQTCRHIKAVHIYELLWCGLHRLTRKVFSESINSSTRSYPKVSTTAVAVNLKIPSTLKLSDVKVSDMVSSEKV